MKKVFAASLLSILLVPLWGSPALAAVTETEVDEILSTYEMTKEDLTIVLSEFGTGLEEFESKEELADALEFYLNHLSEMKDLEEFFATIGLTEVETDLVFSHLDGLNQDELQMKMNNLAARYETFSQNDVGSTLTVAQKNEMKALFLEMMSAFHINPVFYLDGTQLITFENLTSQPFAGQKLVVQLQSASDGSLLGDVELSQDKLTADFMISGMEKAINFGELSGKLPNTASPYLLGMIVGILLMVTATSLYLIRKKMVTSWSKI